MGNVQTSDARLELLQTLPRRLCKQIYWIVHDKQTSRHIPIYKETQHNSTTPEEDFFREKSAASGGTRTHDTLLSRRVLYQLSY